MSSKDIDTIDNINIFEYRSISLISDISETSETSERSERSERSEKYNIKQIDDNNISIVDDDDDNHYNDDITYVDEDYQYDGSPRSNSTKLTIKTNKLPTSIEYNESCNRIYLGLEILHYIFSFVHPQFKMIIHREGTSNEERDQKLSIEMIMISNMIPYFRNIVRHFRKVIARAAARWGRLETLIEVLKFTAPSPEIAIAAAAGNHADVLIWAKDNLCDWNTPYFHMYQREIEKSSIHFRADQCYYDIDVCSEAARAGNFSLLQYAVDAGCPMNWIATSNAAGKNNLNILIWLREKGCEWNDATYRNAIVSGNLDCIEWVRNNGEDIYRGVSALEIAFKCGHLHVIRYLIDNDFEADIINKPWNGPGSIILKDAFTKLAAGKGCVDSLRWSQSLDPMIRPPLVDECCHEAAANGFLDCLRWCLDNGCIWHPHMMRKTLNSVIEQGHLNVLKFLIRSNRGDWDKDLHAIALNHNQGKIIKWIEEAGLGIE